MTKTRKSKINLIILLMILLSFFSSLLEFHSIQTTKIEIDIPKASGYWDLTGSPIVIIGDGDWSDHIGQPWFSGSGTWSDPYTIENVTINGQNIGSCIRIRNTNAYYKILNCTLYNAGNATNDSGLSIWNANNGLVIDNNCSYNNENGMWIYQAQNITVISNNFNHNEIQGLYIRDSTNIRVNENNASHTNVLEGMRFRNSNNVNVSNNKINNNNQEGIEIDPIGGACYDIRFSDNELRNNNGGISLDGSSNISFIENIINNSVEGIFFWSGNGNTVSGNKISNCSSRGITVSSSSNNNLFYENYLSDNNVNAADDGTGNEWNTTAIGNYYDDYGGSDLDDDGIGDDAYDVPGSAGSKDYFPIWDDGDEPIYIDGEATGVEAHNWTWAVSQPWCTGLGTFVSPYVIEDITRDGRGNGFCISVQNSDVYFEVRNCNFTNAGFTFPDSAVLLNNVANATIIGNDLTDTNFIGVRMDNCDSNYIIGNNASFADLGILLTNSKFNHIIGNTINDNIENAINIEDFSDNNTISGNTVINANSYGISIFSDSNSNTVSGNYVESNNVGISMLDRCDFNRVYDNEVVDNNIGVSIHNFNSTVNRVYNNTFLLNNVNGEDDSFNINFWSFGILGNYWDDYGGVDANDDGIGDTSYTVSGTRGRLDNYPIWDDGDDTNPTISIISPSGGSLFGADAPTYNLNIYDLNLNFSWYTLNGTATRYFFTPSNGVNVVSINEAGWDAFSTGTMSMTFYVNDSGGNSANVSNVITKDVTLPTVTVNSPLGGATFGLDAPVFNLTLYDENIFEANYVINPTLAGDSFSPVNGINIVQIDETTWDALAEGGYTFTFSISDTAGNERMVQVVINKDLPSSEPEPGIPFGNYYILFIGIGVVSIILSEYRKRRK